MEIADASIIISEYASMDAGRFYGAPAELSLGAGLIYSGIRYPVFQPEREMFGTRSGAVYVLTHECDVDAENRRPFNDDVVVCPLIPLETFVDVFSEAYPASDLREFLINIAQRRINRILYFPPLPNIFGYGAVLFLNQLAATKISAFERDGSIKVGALSAFGLESVDQVLRNHLFRPKSERLSLGPLG